MDTAVHSPCGEDSDTHPGAVRTDAWLAFGFAFVGGYGDAAGFVLARTFTGHVTGNLVLTAIAVAGRDWRATVEHLLAIATFFAGVFLSELMAHTRKARSSLPLIAIVIGVEIVLIAAAYRALESDSIFRLKLFVFCVSLALGMQNGAFRRAGGINVHTTYLTGMITTLIAAGTDRYLSRITLQPVPATDPKIELLCGIGVAFVLGAGTGAAMIFHFQRAGILGAALVLFGAVVRSLIGRPREYSVG
jgi:uncharacterized membrane protein YoaK (UPF0700 family)